MNQSMTLDAKVPRPAADESHPAASVSLKAAMTNWVWLAELDRMESVLVVGEYAGHTRAGLERQFGRVTHHAQSAVPGPDGHGTPLPFPDGTFDCVSLDAQLGSQALESGPAGSRAWLRETRRVLCDRGCLVLPLSAKSRRSSTRRFTRHVRRAGFRTVRVLYVSTSLERPDTILPASGPAVACYQLWSLGGLRGFARWAMGLVLHHIFHRPLVVLAYR